MPLSFGFEDPFGSGLISLGSQLIDQFMRPSPVMNLTNPAPRTRDRGFFDLPGIDLVSPVALETTVDRRASVESLSNPYHGTPAGRAVPQAHVVANPVTGKLQWFHPAKPGRFTLTHQRKARRACCSRGHSHGHSHRRKR